MVIDRFAGTYGFLSNFSAAEVTFEGDTYKTVEHAFQAAKALTHATTLWTPPWPAPQVAVQKRWRELVQMQPDPGNAKRMGRRIKPIRDDWEAVKVGVMRMLLLEKFAPGRKHLQWLLDTGDAILIEGNTWGDTFWGQCNGRGSNILGELLMQVRHERRQQ